MADADHTEEPADLGAVLDAADAVVEDNVRREARTRAGKRSHRSKRVKLAPTKVPRYDELGPMPIDDPLAMNSWMHRVLGVSAAQVVRDPDLTDSQRRQQLCDLASRMAALTPQSRIFGAESVVKGEAFQANGSKGPEMESVQDAVEVTERAAPRGGAARRGRPRKRGLA